MTDIWGTPERVTRNRAAFWPSPLFLGITAVFAATGWALWVGAGQPQYATFGFVLSGWLLSLCLHEYGHAITAYHSGDRSVADKGYLTLNPLKYTHALYSIVLPLVFVVIGGIGLPGGAVYIDRARLRGRVTESLVSAVGPLTNVLFALVRLVPVALVSGGAHAVFWAALAYLGFLQVTASLLNLIPMPGLDGFGIIEPWLPAQWLRAAARIAPYGFFILLALFWLSPVGRLFFSAVLGILDLLGVPRDALSDGYTLFRFWDLPG
jgi:Zn-dependent protease